MNCPLTTVAVALSVWAMSGLATAADNLLSGPQVGDVAAGFEVDLATGDDAGKKIDLLERWKDKPVLVLFWSDVNRPSFGLVRLLDKYARLRQPEGLEVLLVRATENADEAKKHSKLLYDTYEIKAPAGVTAGGKGGPEGYALNADAGLTVLLLDKEHKVLFNQAKRGPERGDFDEARQAIDKLLGPSPVAFP